MQDVRRVRTSQDSKNSPLHVPSSQATTYCSLYTTVGQNQAWPPSSLEEVPFRLLGRVLVLQVAEEVLCTQTGVPLEAVVNDYLLRHIHECQDPVILVKVD